MEDDMDAELLGLVGGKEEKKQKRSSKKSHKRSKKRKESSDEEGELSDDMEDFIEEDDEPVHRQKPVKKRKRELEEEASDDEKFDDGYDSELYGDDEDRARLNALPEVEREHILAERYTKRQEALSRFNIKQQLKRQKEGKDKRSSTLRSKYEKGNKASAFADLKRKRAKASQAVQSSSEEEEEEEIKDVDSDEEFEIKEDKERSRKERDRPESGYHASHEEYKEESKKEDDVPVSLLQLNAICLKRDWILKKMDEPYFSKITEGCFVRLGIGQNEGKPVYRVAQILDVKERDPYTVGKQKANKCFVLKHGTFTKAFTFECVSNQRITESEFQKWLHEMQKSKLPIITVKDASAKYQAIAKSREYTYSEVEAKEMAEAKMKMRGKPLNIAAEKVKLMILRDEAKDKGDEDEVQALEQQIEELDAQAASGRITVDRSALINARNQQHNRNRSDQSDVRAQINFSSNPQLDPFSRRPTKPSNVISELLSQKLGQKEGNETQENGGGNKEDEKKEDPKVEDKTESKKEERKEKMLDKKIKIEDIDAQTLLKAAHDFDINLDDAPTPFSNVSVTPEKSQLKDTLGKDKPKVKKPSLSVNDYKKRMGLM